MTNPIDPNSGLPPPSTETTTPPTVQVTVQTDTIGEGGEVPESPLTTTQNIVALEEPRVRFVDYNAFLKIISTTRIEHQQQQFENTFSEIISKTGFYLSVVNSLSVLQGLKILLEEATKDPTPLYTEANEHIDTYDTEQNNLELSLAAQKVLIEQFNVIIESFNNGDITAEQYNTAKNEYNASLTLRNQQVQAAIDMYNNAAENYGYNIAPINAEIARLNGLRESLGLPLLDPITPPTALQIPNIQLIQPAPEIPDPNPPFEEFIFPLSTNELNTGLNPFPDAPIPEDISEDVLNTYFNDLATNVTLLGLQTNMIDLDKEAIQQQLDEITGASITLPSDLIKNIPRKFLSSSIAPGAGGSSSISLGLENTFYEVIFSNAIFQETMRNSQIPFNLQSNFALFNVLSLIFAGIYSAVPAAQLLDSLAGKPEERNRLTNLVLGQSFASIVSSVIGSNKEEIAKLVGESLADLPEAEKQAIIVGLTNLNALGSLRFAIFELGRSLGLPGLLPQIIGSILGGDADFIASFNQITLSDVLKNSLSRVFLKDFLNVSFDSILPKEDRESLINELINDLIKLRIENRNEAFLELVNFFQTKGIQKETAERLTNEIFQFVEAEKHRFALNAQLNLEELESETFIAALREKEIVDPSLLPIVEKVLTAKNFANLREFRLELVRTLSDLSPEAGLIAINIANTLREHVFPQVPEETDPLASKTLTTILTQEEIEAKVHSRVIELTENELEREKAEELADKFILTLRDVRDNIQDVIDRTFEDKGEIKEDIRRDLAKSELDLRYTGQRIRDPGHVLFYQMWGLQFQDNSQLPDNFIRYTEFQI